MWSAYWLKPVFLIEKKGEGEEVIEEYRSQLNSLRKVGVEWQFLSRTGKLKVMSAPEDTQVSVKNGV